MWPGPFGRDHDHVVLRRRRDASVVDVEAVGEQDGGARLEVRRDVGLVHGGLDLIGEQQRDDLRAPHRLGDRRHRQPRILGRPLRVAAFAQPDHDLDAGVVQVEGVGVALAAVADDRDLPVEEAEVAVAMNRGHEAPFSSGRVDDWGGATDARLSPIRPVRDSSRMPCGRTSSSNESICSGSPTTSNTIASGPTSATRAWNTSASAISSARRSGRRRDRDQRELALDRLARLQLADAQDVDELVHLLLDLLERLPVAVDAERDRRHVVPLRRADGQAFDVVPAPGEQLADAYERARLVLDEDRQRVDHADTASVSSRSSYSTMSSAAAPAGIIGKQCSSASTRRRRRRCARTRALPRVPPRGRPRPRR